MKIISWNINGLRSIIKKGFGDFIDFTAPDIICLQEIKIDSQTLEKENLNFENFQSHFSCAEKKGYSGVATLINPIQKESKVLYKGIGQKKFDDEGRFLIHHFPKFTLYNTYFPSGTSGELRQNFKYDFLNSFLEFLKKLPPEERAKSIICGDFNICHKDIDIHHPREAEKRMLSGFLPDERTWMDNFSKLGFVDSFRYFYPEMKHQYTWWTFRAGARGKNLGWRIDYIFVGTDLISKIKSAKIHNQVVGSDHCPIELDIDC